MTEPRPPIPLSLADRPVAGGIGVLERLAAGSRPDGDCVVWTGERDRKGYGFIRIGTKHVRAHRAAWIARHGEPPPDKPHVLHHCDNPPCWKEGHLWVGTDADNAADRDAKGRNGYSKRTHCPQNHEYDEANTYRTKDGKRMCRTCLRERDIAAKALKRSQRAPRTRCRNGHPLDGGNVRVSADGRRSCRGCERDRWARIKAEQAANSLAALRREALAAAMDRGVPGLGVSVVQLAAASGLSKAGVHKVLNRLIEQGIIFKPCHGRYRVTPGKLVRDAIR